MANTFKDLKKNMNIMKVLYVCRTECKFKMKNAISEIKTIQIWLKTIRQYKRKNQWLGDKATETNQTKHIEEKRQGEEQFPWSLNNIKRIYIFYIHYFTVISPLWLKPYGPVWSSNSLIIIANVSWVCTMWQTLH